VSFLFSMLFNEPEAFASTVVLMFFFGFMAMLQSRLTAAPREPGNNTKQQ